MAVRNLPDIRWKASQMPSRTLHRLLEWLFGPRVEHDANVETLVCGPLHVTRRMLVTSDGGTVEQPTAVGRPRLMPAFASASSASSGRSLAVVPAIERLPLDVFASSDDFPEPEMSREPAAAQGVESSVRECQWCDAPVEPDAEICPSCGSSVQGDPAASFPGLTELTDAQVEELDRPLRLPRSANADALASVLVGELVIEVDDH